MRTDQYKEIQTFCVMCGKTIPPDRPKQAVTCSEECRDARKNFRRARQDARECRYCRRPSTPAERRRYSRWRRHEEKNPPPDSELSAEELAEREYKRLNPIKRGRKPKARSQESTDANRKSSDAGDAEGQPGGSGQAT